jgi:hypothetical protein
MPDVQVVTGPNVVLDVNVVASPPGGGGGVTDHGALSGLADDDHGQYALADGTRGTFEVAGAVATHSADTTSVHGIADTSALETTTGAQSKVDTHSADTTAVHGIANTANLVLTSDSRLTDARTPTAHASSHHIGGSDTLSAALLAYSPSEPGDWAITPNDIGEALDTLVASMPVAYTDEQVRDVVGATLVAGTNVTLTVDDPGNTITIDAAGGGGGGGLTEAQVRTRAFLRC